MNSQAPASLVEGAPQAAAAPGFHPKLGRPWPLEVVGATELTPRMRRIHVTGEALDEFQSKPGQEMVILIPQEGEPARRHYTIRRFDPAERRIDIDFVLHGRSPATEWARQARPGDRLYAYGPRGRILAHPEAEWHLLSGDETGIPGLFAIMESLPRGAKVKAFIEAADEREKQPFSAEADVDLTWLLRDGIRPGESNLLIEAVAGFQLPEGRGHAYLVGETRVVRAQRQGLIARGLDGRQQISAEGYWRPGRIGGHDHVDRDEQAPAKG